MLKITAGLLCLLLIGCAQETVETPHTEPTESITEANSLRNYYYPVDKLDEAGIVYEYSVLAEGQAFLSHYYHFQQKEEGDKTYLLCNRYNPLFQHDMTIREWVVEDGVITEEYLFHTIDSATQQKQNHANKIKQNVVFPFRATPDSVLAYRFECELKLPPDFLTVKLIRDRKYQGMASTDFKGKRTAAAMFTTEDLYDIENTEEGGFWQQKKLGKEYYAEGIGLIRQEELTVGQEGIVEITALTNQYTWAEFEALQKEK